MKLTFLGTSAAWPSARHNNVCFVAHTHEPILFECGPSILHQLAVAGIDPGTIRTVIVSHIHGDHSLGLPMLLTAAQIARRRHPLTVCLPASAVEPLKRICTTVYPGLGKIVSSLVEWLPLPEEGSGTFCSLAFSGDTGYSEQVAGNAAGADLLVHESNWSVALKTATGHGHSTAAEAGQVAALAKARRLALVHTARELAGHEREIEAEAAAHFGGEVFAPADFSTIDV